MIGVPTKRGRRRALGLAFLACLVTAATPLPSRAEDKSGVSTAGARSKDLGQKGLDRVRLRNFDDFEDLTLSELLSGTGQSLRFGINLFSDVSLLGGSLDESLAFALGQHALLLNASLGEHVRALTEFVIEIGDEGTVVDLERLWLRYDRGMFWLLAGRVHSEIGYWNVAYHHGAWLQLSVDRPRTISFEDEGGFLPIHYAGIFAGARPRVGPGWLSLHIGAANGRGNNNDDVRVVNDTNPAKALLAGVEYEGLGLPNLHLGASAVFDWIAPVDATLRPSLPDTPMREMIFSGYVAYLDDVLTLIGEGHHVRHTAAGQAWGTSGAYALVGYRFGVVTPYARFEWIDPSWPTPDPFYVPDPTAPLTPVDDLVEAVSGIRVETTEWSALKLEYRYAHFLETNQYEHLVVANWSFGI